MAPGRLERRRRALGVGAGGPRVVDQQHRVAPVRSPSASNLCGLNASGSDRCRRAAQQAGVARSRVGPASSPTIRCSGWAPSRSRGARRDRRDQRRSASVPAARARQGSWLAEMRQSTAASSTRSGARRPSAGACSPPERGEAARGRRCRRSGPSRRAVPASGTRVAAVVAVGEVEAGPADAGAGRGPSMKLPYSAVSSATGGIGRARRRARRRPEALDHEVISAGSRNTRTPDAGERLGPGLREQRLGEEHRTSVREREAGLDPGAARLRGLDDHGRQA